MSHRLLLAVVSGFSFGLLACTGALGDSADSAAGGGSTEDRDTDADAWTQSDDCESYLDCLKEVDRDEYDDAIDRYGEDGSCWGTDDDEATGCDDACEQFMDALADDHPTVEECNGSTDTGSDTGTDTGTDTGSDTGSETGTDTGSDTGSDTGTGGVCPLDAGLWGLELEWVSDTCGVSSWVVQDVEVSCNAADEMAMDLMLLDAFPMTLPCDYSGRDFTCSGAESGMGLVVEIDGRASSDGSTATGALVLQLGTDCTSEGIFAGSL